LDENIMDEKSIGFFVVSRSFLLCKRDRERERELGDDEGFVRSVGGLGDAQ
jgi:hypothetical protein